jgi:hypothetical protein
LVRWFRRFHVVFSFGGQLKRTWELNRSVALAVVPEEGQTEAPLETGEAHGVSNGERLDARHQHFGDLFSSK